MLVLLKVLAAIANSLHDFIILLLEKFGVNFTDKDLHFWVIGIIGLLVFVVSDILFRMIAKWSISAISFIYALTVIIVFVFAIEIEQEITGRGNMEFSDISMGLYGFFVFLGVYLLIKMMLYMFGRLAKKHTQ